MPTEPSETPWSTVIRDTQRELADADGEPLSIRGLARLTGIPFETLRDIRSGATRQPTAATIGRLEAGLGMLPRGVTERSRTWGADGAYWTNESLGALQRPPGTIDVKFIYRTDQTPSRRATSEAVSWQSGGIPQMARLLGLEPQHITRVIFRKSVGG